MKIYIGSDHAGFALKENLLSLLKSLGYDVIDKGAKFFDKNDDYPLFIKEVSKSVSSDSESVGIVIGKSGTGEAMCANKTSGVRASLWYGGSLEIIRLSREHNDSNILSLGADFITYEEATEAVLLWLKTPFSGDERHIKRIKMLE